jgi:hypothetical protein
MDGAESLGREGFFVLMAKGDGGDDVFTLAVVLALRKNIFAKSASLAGQKSARV